MVEITKTKWANRRSLNYNKKFMGLTSSINLSFYTPTPIGFASDLSLIAVGTGIGYGIGHLLGVGLEHIPHIADTITEVMRVTSNIEMHNHISGVAGLIGGLAGLRRSGLYLDENLEPKKIGIFPFRIEISRILRK
jgi:hypothetical protein